MVGGDQPCVFIMIGSGGETKIGNHESAHRWTDSAFLEAWHGPESSFCAINEDVIHPVVDADAHFIDNEFVFTDSNGKRKVRVGYEAVLQEKNTQETYVYNNSSVPLDINDWTEYYEDCPCSPYCGNSWWHIYNNGYSDGNCCPWGPNGCEHHCDNGTSWHYYGEIFYDYPKPPREIDLPNGGCSDRCGDGGVGAYVNGTLGGMAEKISYQGNRESCTCNFDDCVPGLDQGAGYWDGSCELNSDEWEGNASPYREWFCNIFNNTEFARGGSATFFENELGWYGYTIEEHPWEFPFECWGCDSASDDDGGGWNWQCNNHCDCACTVFSTDNFLEKMRARGWYGYDSLLTDIQSFSARNSLYGDVSYWDNNGNSLAALYNFYSYMNTRLYSSTGIFSDSPCQTPWICDSNNDINPSGNCPLGHYTLKNWKNLNIENICPPEPPQCMELPFEQYSFTTYYNAQYMNTSYPDSGFPGQWSACGGNGNVKEMVSSIIDEIVSRFGPPIFPTGNINPYPRNIFFGNAQRTGRGGYPNNYGIDFLGNWNGSSEYDKNVLEIVGEFVKQYDERYGKEVTNRLFNPCQGFVAPDIPTQEPSEFCVGLPGCHEPCLFWDENTETYENELCFLNQEDSFGCNALSPGDPFGLGLEGLRVYDRIDGYQPVTYEELESYVGEDAHPIRAPFWRHWVYPHYSGRQGIFPQQGYQYSPVVTKLDIPHGLNIIDELNPPPVTVGEDCDGRILSQYNVFFNTQANPLEYDSKFYEIQQNCWESDVISTSNLVHSYGNNEGHCRKSLWGFGWGTRPTFSNNDIGSPEYCEPYLRFNYITESDELFYPCADYTQEGFAYSGGSIGPSDVWWPEDANDLGSCDLVWPPGSQASTLGIPTNVAEAIYYSPCPTSTPEQCEQAQETCASSFPPDWCSIWEGVDCNQCLGYPAGSWNPYGGYHNGFWDYPTPGNVTVYNYGNISQLYGHSVFGGGGLSGLNAFGPDNQTIDGSNLDYMILLNNMMNSIFDQKHCDCEKEVQFGRTCTGIFLPENEGEFSTSDMLRQPFFEYTHCLRGACSENIHTRPYCNEDNEDNEEAQPFLEGLLSNSGVYNLDIIPNRIDYFCGPYDLPNYLIEYGEDNPTGEPVNWETLGKCAEIYEWNLCPY